MTHPATTSKVAILFRYVAGEHVDFLPALPEIVRQLQARGVEVHHFGYKGGVALPENLQNSLRVHAGPFRVRRKSEWDKHVKALLWLASLPFLGRRLQREGFDRVFVDETLPLSAMFLQWGYRGKLAFTVHDFFMEIYGERNTFVQSIGHFLHPLDLKAWRKLDRIFTRVQAAKIHLQAEGMDGERIAVVPDPVDLRLFHPDVDEAARAHFRASWGVESTDLLMVHHGIMHPNKCNVRLVEALARLRDQVPELKLLLIGDGHEMKRVRQSVVAHGLADRVILTGWLPGMPEIADALRASDIGLVMRKGLQADHFHVTSTLVHNLACGLPVLAARLGGIAEVITEGREGYLFDLDDGASFDAALLKLARDAEGRKVMGQRARALELERFDPVKIAAHYVSWMCP